MVSKEHRSGFIAVIGRPNVGKSTLVNALTGHKVSITSHRSQTTRNRILGIKSVDDAQFVFVDTPGLHDARGNTLNRIINQTARDSLDGVDVVLMLVAASKWTFEDDHVLQLVKQQTKPVVLGINKIDLFDNRNAVLPMIESVSPKFEFAEIVPLSAQQHWNADHLINVLGGYLPLSPPLFPEDQYTDQSLRFQAGEIVREQLFRLLGEEVPYSAAVEVESFDDTSQQVTKINCLVWVERPGQKKIVIGPKGKLLKTIGERSRKQLEHLLGTKVHLELWVKVKSGWANKEASLRGLGFTSAE